MVYIQHKSTGELFWNKVDRKDGDGCWEWIGPRNHDGYGRFNYKADRSRLAHRVSWVLCYGEIPSELRVLHKCDNRACVRPDHLFLGTQADNVQDCINKNRFADHRGEGNSRHILTEKQVLCIKENLAEGISVKSIASEYSVNWHCIWKIKRGITWKYLENGGR